MTGNELAGSFEGLGLAAALSARLSDTGIAEPTAVQAQAIPAILAGRDGVLVSPTGTGKTLAYLLPILQRLDGTRRETQAVVLAPTQELAMQIVREAERYGEALGIKTVALIGGAALSRQLERMKAKPALVVGTPGRVREVVSLRKLSLPGVRHIVVDETDRVFSLGGRADVEKMLRQCARDRQTVFVSATRSDAMREAERLWLADPWESDAGTDVQTGVDSGAEGTVGAGGLPDSIQHWYFVADRRDKVNLAGRLLRHAKLKPALLFLNDTEKIGELSAKMKYEGMLVDTLYGDTPGRERGEALRRFRAGKTALLIATDLAARGLDVPGLPLVIQFEPALDADHYVHRAGRTGRMGKEGVSVTIVTPKELFIVEKLSKQLGIRMQLKTLYEGRVVAAEEAGAGRRGTAKREKDGGPLQQEAELTKPGPIKTRTTKLVKPAHPDQSVHPHKPDSSGQSTGRAGGSRRSAGSQQAAPAKSKGKDQSHRERERDRKNKGAPRWLKQKRESGSVPDSDLK